MQSIKYAVYQKWVPKSVVKMQQIKLQFKLIVYSVYSCYQTFSPENLSYLQSLQQMHSKIWHVPTYIHTMHEKYVPELIVKILSISVDTEETLQSRDFSLSSQTYQDGIDLPNGWPAPFSQIGWRMIFKDVCGWLPLFIRPCYLEVEWYFVLPL